MRILADENIKLKLVNFLKEKLKLELHPDKSKIIALSRGIDFVGFRNFYHFKLLRKRNIRKILKKVELYKNETISHEKILESFQEDGRLMQNGQTLSN